jgi:hypothetical protein
MNPTLTIRLTDELLAWLEETSQKTGMSVGRLIREHLESAKSSEGKQRFMQHLGAIRGGPRDFSSRKGLRGDESDLRSLPCRLYKNSIPCVRFAFP